MRLLQQIISCGRLVPGKGRGRGSSLRCSLSAAAILPVLIVAGLSLVCLRAPAQAPSAEQPAGAAPAGEAATPTALPPPAPWEYSPYQIRVWVAAAGSAEVDPLILTTVMREIHLRADSVVGAPWSLTVSEPPPALAATVAYTPEMLTDARIAEVQKEALKDDKIVLVSLQANPREIDVHVRELDCHARLWGPTVTRSVRQPDALPQTVFDAMLTAFSPLARIEEGQGKTCIARAKAGGLVLSPDSPAYIKTGDVLQPIFRQNDRYGDPIPKRTQALPFTYLHVTSQDSLSPSLLNCNVHSAMRSPIHGRPTSRRERWAVKVRPALPETEIVLESKPSTRDEVKVPLAGMEIYAKTPLPEPPKSETQEEIAAAEKKNPPVLLGVTDWRGSLKVPNEGPTLRVMYVKSGGLLLARLPVVAGTDRQLVAEVPDDNPRLQAEGFVKGMNGEITDLVVQRQLIKVRVRKKITEGKFDEAQKLLDEFRGLKTLNDLQRMLDQQMTRQKPTNNPGVKQRIDKLYADEREMIAKYLDVELFNQLTLELADARRNPTAVITPSAESQSFADDKNEKKALPSALQSKGTGAAPASASPPPSAAPPPAAAATSQ